MRDGTDTRDVGIFKSIQNMAQFLIEETDLYTVLFQYSSVLSYPHFKQISNWINSQKNELI